MSMTMPVPMPVPMPMKFISLGGWCGTTVSLRGNELYQEALPFDHIRSTFPGIIDCIQNDFQNFFPKKIEIDILEHYFYSGKSCRGKYFGFYHHNLLENTILQDFERRIERFQRILAETKEDIVFVRTIATHHYQDEMDLVDSFWSIVSAKYPLLSFIFVFVIPGQASTEYVKCIREKTFVFTLNDNSHNNDNLAAEYFPIYDYLRTHDLFRENPLENETIVIRNGYNRFVEVEGLPFVREDN